MKIYKNKFMQGFLISILFHVIIAAAIGLLGYSFVNKNNDILEVNFVDSSSGEIDSSNNMAIEDSTKLVDEQDSNFEEDPIIDKKVDVQKEKKERQQTNALTSSKNNTKDTMKNNGLINKNSNNNGQTSKKGSLGGQGSSDLKSVVSPRILAAPNPKYPENLRNKGIESTVTVKILVSALGNVEDVFIITSSGYAEMDQAALKGIYKWKFSPAKDKFGKKSRCYVTQVIYFTLKR